MTNAPLDPSVTPPEIHRFRLVFLVIGVALLLACIPGWIFVPKMFYPAYLFAWLFWLGVSLGGLATIMLHHTTGGGWGYFVRRFGEAAGAVTIIMPVLFIPIFFGLKVLYPWHPGNPSFHEPHVEAREMWFNTHLWIIRWAITLAIFIFWTWALRILSLRHDKEPTYGRLNAMYCLSAAGMVVYFVIMSLAGVDWIMSRVPEWRSTMFGFIIVLGQCVSGLCLLIIMLGWVARRTPFRERVSPDHFNDLGNLLLTCVILWAYCSFAQLLITYLGNGHGETTWYMPRTSGPWHAIAAVLIVFHFLVPFFLLLMRSIKRYIPAIMWLCALLLVMRMLDVFWITIPSGEDAGLPLAWSEAALAVGSVIGIGGVWMAVFLWLLEGHSLIPLGESVPLLAAPLDEDESSQDWERHDGIEHGPQPGPIG